MPPPTHPQLPGPAARGYPLRAVLVALIVGLLTCTTFAIGAVAYWGMSASINDLSVSLFREVSNRTSLKVQGLLEPAHSILLECRHQAERGLLPVDDQDALGERLIERFRYEQRLYWLSYGDAQGRFTGAWRRRDDGAIILNRSTVGPQGGTLVEEIVNLDGSRELVRSNHAWTYDPRDRPWYKLASSAPGPVWTPPYDWWDTQERGVTCTIALRDGERVVGAFTADFRLQDLSDFLNSMQIMQTGRAFVVDRAGSPLAGSANEEGDPTDPLLVAALAAAPVRLEQLQAERPQYFTLEHRGTLYAAAMEAFRVADGLEWVSVVVVPSHEFLGGVWRNVAWTVVIGVLALIVAALAGSLLSRRIARPLDLIAADLAEVGRFNISTRPAPPTRIREIGVVGQAAERMKTSLRSFSRYVPTDLVRELVETGQEARLGGELRQLTIYFADITGFTSISERIEAGTLVESLGQYFAAIARTLAEHGGTLDKFAGDGVVAFFNAPRELPDHAAAACRAALAAQQDLRRRRRLWEAQGRPPFRARIGLHTAEVVVGNIGTPDRFAYTVIGDGVNLASGLEALSKVYGTSILASQQTRDAAGPGFEWRRIDRISVKGRAQTSYVYELLGETGEVPEHRLAARDAYELGIDAMLRGGLKEAQEFFRVAQSADPLDEATQLMLRRVGSEPQRAPSDARA